MQERQNERERLLADIGAAEAVGELTADRRAIERKVLDRVADWQALLNGDVAELRQCLREILDGGPIRFTPDPKRKAYHFEGNDARGHLIAGLVGVSTLSGVPNDSQLEPDR